MLICLGPAIERWFSRLDSTDLQTLQYFVLASALHCGSGMIDAANLVAYNCDVNVEVIRCVKEKNGTRDPQKINRLANQVEALTHNEGCQSFTL